MSKISSHLKDLIFRAVQQYGTPLYCYDIDNLDERLLRLKKSLPNARICFALKANNNLTVMKEIFKHGIGADVVSLGEMKKSIFAGLNPKKIVFSGVGKTYEELYFAAENDIGLINVESGFEIQSIQRASQELGKTTAVCIRVNPNIQIKSNPKISTGLDSTKFGVPLVQLDSVIENIKSCKNIKLVGLACHIGSQMLDLGGLQKASQQMTELSIHLQQKHRLKFEFINLGGGLGISYHGEKAPEIEEYAAIVKKAAVQTGLKLVLELGRWVTGPTGVLVSRVIGVKKNQTKNFVIIDAGMNDLLRPALYDAPHGVETFFESSDTSKEIVTDIVGPVCETSDLFVGNTSLREPAEGDLLAFTDVGAYGFSMSSNYNIRLMPAEVTLQDGKVKLVRKRQVYEELWQNELV